MWNLSGKKISWFQIYENIVRLPISNHFAFIFQILSSVNFILVNTSLYLMPETITYQIKPFSVRVHSDLIFDVKYLHFILVDHFTPVGCTILSQTFGVIWSTQTICMSLYNVINQVISYWPSYRSKVCCTGPRPKAEGQYSWPRTCNWANTKLLD